MNSKSQFKIGAAMSYFSIAFNIIAGLIYTPWMIDQIGQSDYGIYTLATSLISLFLMDFGLSSATSRFVAKYRAEGKEEEITFFLESVYKLYLLIDCLIFCALICLFFLLDIVYPNFSPEELEKLRVVYIIVGAYSLISFPATTFNGILNAYEKFIPLKCADFIQRLSMIAMTVIALLSGGGLYSLVFLTAVSGIIAIVIKFYYVNRSIPARRCIVKDKAIQKVVYRQILTFSIWATIASLSQRMFFTITPTILGIVVVNASAAIAVFGIISTIEGYVYTITTAIKGMFLHRISQISINDIDGMQLTLLMIRVGRFQFALNGLILVGFVLLGKQFITLWVGENYIMAYYGIVLVLIPGLFYNSLQIGHTAITVYNLVKYQAYIEVISGIMNLIMSIPLSYHFGVVGAAASICISYTLRLALNLFFINKKLNIEIGIFIKECYTKMLVPLMATGILGYFILSAIHNCSWLWFIIKGCTVVTIYAGSLLTLKFLDSEKKNDLFYK